MLCRLKLTDFKAFQALDLPLQRFTVVVGPNGVGKTSILRALRLVSGLGTAKRNHRHSLAPFDDLFSDRDAAGSLVRRPDADGFSLSVELSGKEGFEVRCAVPGGALTGVECRVWSAGRNETLSLPTSANTNPGPYFEAPPFHRLDGSRFLQLDPRVLAVPALVASGRPRLGDDGANLATVLDYMASRRDGSIEAVEAALRRVVPSFRRVHCEPVELKWDATEVLMVDQSPIDRTVHRSGPGRALELEFDGIGRIPASEVSEGTLLALALLTVVYGPDRPRLLLLDDIDRALHPRAQVELVKLLKAVLTDHPGLQIVCTAHSPMVVAGCTTEEVVHLEFGADGAPAVRSSTGDPPWMTPTEIMADYFGIHRLGTADLMQRYGLLAGNPARTAAEDAEARELLLKLVAADADPGWKPVPRKRGRKETKEHA